jgi:glucose/arabinose dehydrogenase
MDWHPTSGELYFTENGRDWMGNEQPEDELNHVRRAGLHFGFPHCYQENVVDPRLALGHACAEFEPPIETLGPHVAALGMRFYTGGMFPAAYRNRALIALHGSWNRNSKTGFSVVQATIGAKGAKLEPFMEGFLEGERFWGRPVDVHQLPDGSVLVADDWNGAIYRVLYRP